MIKLSFTPHTYIYVHKRSYGTTLYLRVNSARFAMSLLSRLPQRSSSSRGPTGAADIGESGRNVLLCLTGSVASVRVANVYRALLSTPSISNVVIVLTPSAKRFLANPPLPVSAIVIDDEADWTTWSALGDPVLHIELRNWADALVIAPLSANSLAKLAGGLCDNLVTCVARAWPIGTKPFVVAPAMNTAMWNHPITGAHLRTLQRAAFGVTVVQPVEKELACGDFGIGAMASPVDIASVVSDLLTRFAPPSNTPVIIPPGDEPVEDGETSGLAVEPGPSIVQTDCGQSIEWPNPWQWSSPAAVHQTSPASFSTVQPPSPIQFHPPLPVELEQTTPTDSRRRHCRKINCPNQRDLCPGRWPRGKCPSEYN